MKISVVTISFNQCQFLEQAIQSVLDQDYPDIEYVVVDPGSSDGSRELIQKYRSRLSKAIFEPDRGPADGLNRGFRELTGDIYCYINADDFFEPGAFQAVARYFSEHPDIDIVCGAAKIADAMGRTKLKKPMSDLFDLEKYAAGTCISLQQATFFRSRCFAGNAERFNILNRTCWDGELLVDMALDGRKFGILRRVLGNFRIYPGSITGSQTNTSAYLKDCERIRGRIAAHLGKSPNRMSTLIGKYVYKFNIVRHLGYFLLQ